MAREIYLLSAKNVRRAIIEAYGGICQYCGETGADHIDHITARSKGGKNALRNYILACRSCNQRKGAGEIAETYLALITAIAQKNEKRIAARIHALNRCEAVKGYKIGLSRELSIFVSVDRRHPTIEQLRHMEIVNDFWSYIAGLKNAEKQNNAAIA